jgi:cobalt-zinc-cadmium efflux system protein
MFIFSFELAGGLLSGSLALLSDSGHVLIDNVAVIVSIVVAIGVSRSSDHIDKIRWRTYGARASALMLAGIGVWIMKAAIDRLTNSQEIKTGLMVGTATLGCIGNYCQHLVLHKADDKSHSTHQLLHLHVISDLAQSIAVVIGGILIYATGAIWIDPALSLAIGALMVWWGAQFLIGRKRDMDRCRCGGL